VSRVFYFYPTTLPEPPSKIIDIDKIHEERERKMTTNRRYLYEPARLTCVELENAILDLFEKNKITFQDGKVILWILLTAIYEVELIEEPRRREIYF
jgi:hypothetical protein